MGGVALFASDKVLFSGKVENFFAATLFVPSVTTEELKTKFDTSGGASPGIKILLMPGHEPDFGGAEYGSLKERDMNVDMANLIRERFAGDERFEIIIARDKESWHSTLEAYFENNWEMIKTFIRAKKAELDAVFSSGQGKKSTGGIIHNRVSDDVALRLYGINKWASEREVDIVLHIHFNDHPRSRMSAPGIYKGFAIYVPDKIFSNHKASLDLAQNLKQRLESSFDVSDFPPEKEGIVESQSLIAVGARNTLDSGSVLIEYGYIYRPSFTNKSLREETLSKMAELTHLGILDFFEGE